jgi:DNA-binding beta-propeller fold protein YncE
MAIDKNDLVYIVDMTARIQVFTASGEFVRAWKTPKATNGKPCGLSFDRDGNLLVADTHYFRMLVYSPLGDLLCERTIGGVPGHEPGQFSFVTDCVQDSEGNYFISEYGDMDRVQKFTRDGKFIAQWGGHGSEPGQFVQPRSLAIDEEDQIWVADACNHRIQVFKAAGDAVELVRIWGEQGREAGQLSYPYGLALDGHGYVYVCEFGNSRVQKFTLEGEYVGHWGRPGRQEGELYEPWEIAFDTRGKLYVLDTNNHRVQRIRF